MGVETALGGCPVGPFAGSGVVLVAVGGAFHGEALAGASGGEVLGAGGVCIF